MSMASTSALLRRSCAPFALAALLLTPTVAAAEPGDREMAAAVAALDNPRTADGLARIMAAATRALMQLRVGPIAEAVAEADPDSRAADVDPDATLGDMAGVDADRMADDVGDQTRRSAAMMGTMARTMATMAPVFRAMARDMTAQMERAMRERR